MVDVITQESSQRPWGYYVVLADMPDHKVKRIHIKPGKRLSLQRHKHRAEHWHIITGIAIVTRNNEQLMLNSGDSVDIPKGQFIELKIQVQTKCILLKFNREITSEKTISNVLKMTLGAPRSKLYISQKNIVAGRNFYPNSPCHRLQHALVGLHSSPPPGSSGLSSKNVI